MLIADHLDQEAGGRAPRQLCCIAVTAKMQKCRNCKEKMKLFQSNFFIAIADQPAQHQDD